MNLMSRSLLTTSLLPGGAKDGTKHALPACRCQARSCLSSLTPARLLSTILLEWATPGRPESWQRLWLEQEKQQQEKAAAGIAAAQPVEKQIRSWNLCCWIRLLPVEMQNIMLLIQHIIIVKLEDSAREWPCNLGLRSLSILGTLFWAQKKRLFYVFI